MRWSSIGAGLLWILMLAISPSACRSEQVILANGMILRGEVERDNSIVSIYDGLKRTVVRDSKIRRIEAESAQQRQDPERFALIQPMAIQGGAMPSHAVGVQATPWDAAGQRLFQYSYFTDPKTRKQVRMKQAINELGPDFVKYRGIDGFWIGYLSTTQVPRPVVLGLLGQVDQTLQNERLRVARFLIQAKWYDEAMAELDRLAKDYPELKETTDGVRALVLDLRARRVLEEARLREGRSQPRGALELLKACPMEGISEPLIAEIEAARDGLIQRDEAARTLLEDLRVLLGSQSATVAATWTAPLTEVQQALVEAPDLALSRIGPAFKTGDPALPPERLARLMSGWMMGPDHAIGDLVAVEAIWSVRERMAKFLGSTDAEDRALLLDALLKTSLPDVEPGSARAVGLDEATWLVRGLPPSRAEGVSQSGVTLIRRVLDDPNPKPTEYAIVLPPEYHPLRSYPAVVALHDGRGPSTAIERWAAEAGRRGYIVVAPDYLTPGESPDYRYSPDEHAAVQLAVRDARKRFAIDSDRIFLAGSLMGGNAAWDVALAHPDLFAGFVPISGLPAKYVTKTRSHVQYVPLYFPIGDLSTAATASVVFDPVKAQIAKSWDVTYVEYARRGLEDFPEEIPAIFDWMDVHRRVPYRKEFAVDACRPGDDRFWGVVVRAFTPGRVVLPEAVDPLGKDLNPATIEKKTSTLGNLISLTVSGVDAIDLWIAPDGLDFAQKLQVRVNGKRLYNEVMKPDLGAFLDDVRLRGDRQQVYWAKIGLGGKAN